MQGENLLRKFRQSNKLSIEEIASKLGISASFYEKIEYGDRNPSYNFMFKFKQVFPNAKIDTIFFKNNNHDTCT